MTIEQADLHDAADETRLQQQAALSYVTEAFEEARLDGIEDDCLVQMALFASFSELVRTYGEDAAAVFAERLPERIRHGEFTLSRTKQ